MYYIDPHIHMVSRTTDDYETLAKMGCVALSEPAFWAGYDRGNVHGFRDYFEQLTAFGPSLQDKLLLSLRSVDKPIVVRDLEVDKTHANRQHPTDNKRRNQKRAAF